jgi:hypothetical protein
MPAEVKVPCGIKRAMVAGCGLKGVESPNSKVTMKMHDTGYKMQEEV